MDTFALDLNRHPYSADEFVEFAKSLSDMSITAHERGVHELVRTRRRRSRPQSPKHSLGDGSRTTRPRRAALATINAA
jgi:hypothetical protein